MFYGYVVDVVLQVHRHNVQKPHVPMADAS